MPIFGPVQVIDNARDGQETSDTSWRASGHDSDGSRVGRVGADDYDMGMSWVTTIPQGVTIISATIRVFMKWRTPGISDIVTRMQGLAVDNVAPFSGTNRPSQHPQTTAFVDRTYTSAVDWVDESWLTLDDASSIVQEIVNRPGFGGTLGVVLKENGSASNSRWQLQDFGRQSAFAPEITVEYTIPSGDTAIDATVTSKTIQPFNATVSAAVDTNILASTKQRIVQSFNAAVSLTTDTNILASAASSLAIVAFPAAVFASVDTNIAATSFSKSIIPENAVVSLTTDTAISAVLHTKTIQPFNAEVFSGVDTDISATLASKTVNPFNAFVDLTQDTVINAGFVTKTITPFDADVQGNIDTHISGSTPAIRTVQPLNASIDLTTNVNIAATSAQKTIQPFNADVSVGADVNIPASFTELTIQPFNAVVSLVINTEIQAELVTRTVQPFDALITTATDIPIAGTLATKTIQVLNATVTLLPTTDINATLASKLIFPQRAEVYLGSDTLIFASLRTKVVQPLNSLVFVGQDLHLSATLTTKTVNPFNAIVVGVGGLSLTPALLPKTIQTFPADIVPGKRINAWFATKTRVTFPAQIYTGNIQALVVSKVITGNPATVYLHVNAQAGLLTKNINLFPATVTQEQGIIASRVIKVSTPLKAVVAHGSSLQITTQSVRKRIETFKALVAGIAIPYCDIRDLNLTIPHSITESDDQQRVLIENFSLLLDCYLQLEAFMKKCCAAKGTLINAFTAERTIITRRAVIEQTIVSCIYEDFVPVRTSYGIPDYWWKLNNTGTPATVPSDGDWGNDLTVTYNSFGLTNNIQFESTPVITQVGTKSLGFAPTYLEGSYILESQALSFLDDTPADVEFEYWIKLGDAGHYMAVENPGWRTLIDVKWFGSTFDATVARTFDQQHTVSSLASYATGDVVHVVVQLRDFGLWDAGRLSLYINGLFQASIFIPGQFAGFEGIGDLRLILYGATHSTIPSYIDQITLVKQVPWKHMTPAEILATYNCGIGA